MKFKSEKDKAVLEMEANKSGISVEEQFLRRRKIEIGLTDWERRLAQKQNWREKRAKYLAGIRKFHRSTRGKEFHRRLGRFLATRDTIGKLAYYQGDVEKERFLESVDFSAVEKYREEIIAVLSAMTHALIEERYFEANLEEAVSYKLFLGVLIAEGLDTIKKLCEGKEEEVDWEFWKEVILDKEEKVEEGDVETKKSLDC